MEKTILQYLIELPEPFKSQAVKNCTQLSGEKRLKCTTNSKSRALRQAFVWSDSPEGYQYWSDLQFQTSKQ